MERARAKKTGQFRSNKHVTLLEAVTDAQDGTDS